MTQNLTPHEQLVQRFIDEALHTQNEEDEDDSRLMTGKTTEDDWLKRIKEEFDPVVIQGNNKITF